MTLSFARFFLFFFIRLTAPPPLSFLASYLHTLGLENSDCKRLDRIYFHEIVNLKVKVSSSYTSLHFLLKPLQMAMSTVLLGWGED